METALDRLRVRRRGAVVLETRLDLSGAGATALALLLVLSIGFTDGGYYGRSSIALTVALATAAGFSALTTGCARPARTALATVAALGLMTAWVAASASWAANGSAVEGEIRRCVLYAVALAAVLVVVDRRRCVPFLAGLVASIALVAAAAVGMRSASGMSLHPFYGALLEEPVGYPNALGVLVVIGAVLAVGLGVSVEGRAALICRATPGPLGLVLGLTGSRGGGLALLLGFAVLVVLLPAEKRVPAVGAVLLAVAVGGCAWAAAAWTNADGAVLAATAGTALGVSAVLAPVAARLGRRALGVAAAVLVALVLAGIAVHPPQATSSFRTAYWETALAAVRERPVLGTGAGSFYLSWREHRPVDVAVRDAHSLYVETLSELGPVGLGLVLALVAAPLVFAARHRGDPLGATAAAGFAVFAAHAGVDWDWEMPVVTLAALGCAGAVFARASISQEGEKT